jgi:hypothetical protein
MEKYGKERIKSRTRSKRKGTKCPVPGGHHEDMLGTEGKKVGILNLMDTMRAYWGVER